MGIRGVLLKQDCNPLNLDAFSCRRLVSDPVLMRLTMTWSELRVGSHITSQTVVFHISKNSDLSQTSHCNIKGLSVSEVMRIENMITQVQFY